MINVFQPQLGDSELRAISEVFESNWIGKGKKTEQFEFDFSKYIGVDRKQVTSTTCCTVAFFSILESIKLTPEDEVIIPDISFVGVANAVVSSGAKLVFCDVDYRTLNITMESFLDKVTKRTKAVIVIHYGGVPVKDIFLIKDFCEKNGIFLIEDSACSVSSKYKEIHCGTIGDYGAFSFDAMKILVTGDGSIIYSKNKEIINELNENLYLGLKSKSGINSAVDSKWWEFEISSCSSRNIINDITAAIGIVQLKKLDKFISRRKEIHVLYDLGLQSEEWMLLPPLIEKSMESSYYFYWIQTECRDELARYMRDNEVYTTFRYYPLHKVSFYGHTEDVLPNSDKASADTLCIPIHQSLSNYEVEKIINLIKKFK